MDGSPSRGKNSTGFKTFMKRFAMYSQDINQTTVFNRRNHSNTIIPRWIRSYSNISGSQQKVFNTVLLEFSAYR